MGTEVEILYIVTGAVVAALFGWVVAVWKLAPDAPDRSKVDARVLRTAPPQGRTPAAADDKKGSHAAPQVVDVTPGPAVVDVVPRGRDVLIPRAAAVPFITEAPQVVQLPTIRTRLDSHMEIQDSTREATVIVMEDDEGPVSRDPLVLESAVGRATPSPTSGETHAVVDRHHLFLVADEGGKDKTSQIAAKAAVKAMTLAIDGEQTSIIPDDPMIPRRANRLRRAILSANRRIFREASSGGVGGIEAMVVAAYFTPNNQRLYVASVGDGRCYRLRAREIRRIWREPRVEPPRALGISENLSVLVATETPVAGDLYLVCSGVLARVLTEQEIVAIVTREPDISGAATRLIERARVNAPTEAMTAILVRVSKPVKK